MCSPRVRDHEGDRLHEKSTDCPTMYPQPCKSGAVDTALHMLDVLVERYSFADVAVLVNDGVCQGRRTDAQIAEIEQLCAFGSQLLDLDAEDFGNPDAAENANTEHRIADHVTGDAVPPDLVERAERSRMPRSPKELDRGALGSLRPAFSLLLEVIAIRWLRRDTSAMVAALHIASEYLPLLAWEPVLGHAGDPARMPESVGGAGSLWGELENRDCPQTRSQKSAAQRCLRVQNEPDSGWQAYLDKQHSTVSEGLAMCAANCKTACSVISRHSARDRQRLARACHVAEEFASSTLIQLRHSAPVGHGFGVPSLSEVCGAWAHSREVLASKAPSVRVDDGYPLPGLTSLFSDLADARIHPDTLIRDTMLHLRKALAEGA